MKQKLELRQRVWLTVAAVVVVLLAAAVFTLGSLRIPLTPEQGSAFVILFALSTFIAAALLVFTLILTRTLLPEMSGQFLARMAAGQPITSAHVGVGDKGEFRYEVA